jgi:hypothetical protein
MRAKIQMRLMASSSTILWLLRSSKTRIPLVSININSSYRNTHIISISLSILINSLTIRPLSRTLRRQRMCTRWKMPCTATLRCKSIRRQYLQDSPRKSHSRPRYGNIRCNLPQKSESLSSARNAIQLIIAQFSISRHAKCPDGHG